jgi:hypothetical protein
MTRHIAGIQQKYTQSGGVRPFGISTLVAGLGVDGKPCLFQTDPSGTHSAWGAAAVGRNAKTVREFLEKEYEKAIGVDGPAKLAVRALMEAVEAGGASVEVAELRAPPPPPPAGPAAGGAPAAAAGPPPSTDPPRAVLRFLSAEEVDALVKGVEEDKAAEAARKKAGGGGGGEGEG